MTPIVSITKEFLIVYCVTTVFKNFIQNCSRMFRSTTGYCPYMEIVDFNCNSTCKWTISNNMQNRFYCALFENCTGATILACVTF